MNRQKIYLALVLALIFMSSCGSSAKLAKNHDEMKSDPRIWDYLNVSDRERTLVDSIVALDEYAVFLDSYKKYRTKKNAMREGRKMWNKRKSLRNMWQRVLKYSGLLIS